MNVIFDCDDDEFSFNPEMPKGLDPKQQNLFTSITQADTFPVLKIVEVINKSKSLKIDISDRFQSLAPPGICPIDEFKI